jgi:beta-galactosidase
MQSWSFVRSRWLLLAACAACAVRAPPRSGGAPAAAPREGDAGSARKRLSLDPGWRFHLGDLPAPRVMGHEDSYRNAKAGAAWGAAAPDFDDAGWRALDLPHDWVVEGPFDRTENLAQGYRPRGVGWYRRALRLDPADRGRHLELEFDGIATHATVWFNGQVVARSWSGYTASYIDITPYAKYGDELNVIAVRVDADAMEGWWYEGGGIYRHTWLVERDPVHIVTDGVYAMPRRSDDGSWVLPVEVTLANSGADAAMVDVETTLADPRGNAVGRARTRVRVEPLGEVVATLLMAAASPRLWSVEDPALYAVHTTVSRAGAPLDDVTVGIGFRYARFDADRGFFLNGEPLKIKGVCTHQDHAGVGVAVPDALWEFRLRRLKELGANALRCSHNAPPPELLDAADRLGILVMDENRNFDVSPEGLRQLTWLVRRDRNHPSVFLWSVFNEEPMQGTEVGYQMVRRMSAEVKRLDDTRPVTAAMNGGMFEPVNVSQAVDVVGFNYQIGDYDRFHAAHPALALISSEDTSAFMTRGEYVTDKARNVVASYDDEAAWWGATHRAAWRAIADRPFVAGGFVWSGFDYRGEPTPFTWPSASSFFGIMDTCGFPKMAFYLRRAQWIRDRPVLALVPHWSWPGREGQPIRVMALTNVDTVALIVNGHEVSEKHVDADATVSWEVPYAPGRVEAIGKKNGQEVTRDAVETTGAPARLELSPDRARMAGDGWDAEPVTVRVVDAAGRAVPTASFAVDFAVTGGRIIGLGNGDPNSHEPEKGARRSLFNGLAQVIVQTLAGGAGELVLTASAGGVESARAQIRIEPAAPRPSVPSPDARPSTRPRP